MSIENPFWPRGTWTCVAGITAIILCLSEGADGRKLSDAINSRFESSRGLRAFQRYSMKRIVVILISQFGFICTLGITDCYSQLKHIICVVLFLKSHINVTSDCDIWNLYFIILICYVLKRWADSYDNLMVIQLFNSSYEIVIFTDWVQLFPWVPWTCLSVLRLLLESDLGMLAASVNCVLVIFACINNF